MLIIPVSGIDSPPPLFVRRKGVVGLLLKAGGESGSGKKTVNKLGNLKRKDRKVVGSFVKDGEETEIISRKGGHLAGLLKSELKETRKKPGNNVQKGGSGGKEK